MKINSRWPRRKHENAFSEEMGCEYKQNIEIQINMKSKQEKKERCASQLSGISPLESLRKKDWSRNLNRIQP